MKRFILVTLTLFLMLGGVTNATQIKKNQGVNTAKSANVEVYYFHFTRRCMTCNAVEAESRKALQALYPALLKSGKLSFKSINLDESSSKSISDKCGAEGQSLLIIQGKNRTDLTSEGFMYAVNNPEKLKSELKKIIDPLIK